MAAGSPPLPTKLQQQIAKASLPQTGAEPYRPMLTRNRRNQSIIAKGLVITGPWKGKVGWLDDQNRIWVRDYAHAGLPDHWDVQDSSGKSYFRVDMNGMVLFGAILEQKTKETRWGSAAVGRAGRCTIEVDEAIDGPPAWLVGIEAPAVYFSIRLSEISPLLWIRRVFAGQDLGPNADGFRLFQSKFQLQLLPDTELDGRIFVHFAGPAHNIRFTIGKDEAAEIVAALTDVIEQLELEDSWTVMQPQG